MVVWLFTWFIISELSFRCFVLRRFCCDSDTWGLYYIVIIVHSILYFYFGRKCVIYHNLLFGLLYLPKKMRLFQIYLVVCLKILVILMSVMLVYSIYAVSLCQYERPINPCYTSGCLASYTIRFHWWFLWNEWIII